MNRYRTPFSQLKTSAGKPPADRKGVAPASSMPMKTAAWSMPKPVGTVGFNKTTRAKVVKQYPVKHGLD